MLVDFAINPFDADLPDMVEMARRAEHMGCSAVWVADHFSGAVVDRAWSRDPFVTLGAMGAATERIDLGLLVANVVNRHPAQLASAVNSLQSLAPGRVRLGVGSGASPGSRFAVEHEAIGRVLEDSTSRRRRLIDSIGAVRAIFAGTPSFEADSNGFDDLDGVVDRRHPCPPIIVGASAWSTIEAAIDVADGVNLRTTPRLLEHLERLGRRRQPGFEVSVLDWVRNDERDLHALARHGCDRLVLGVSAPFDDEFIDAVDVAAIGAIEVVG